MGAKPPITDDILAAPSEDHAWTDAEVAEHVAAGDWTDEALDDAEPAALGEAEDQT